MMGLWDLGGMAQALPQIFGAKVALVPRTLAHMAPWPIPAGCPC